MTRGSGGHEGRDVLGLDEYGPFITHFDSSGRQIARLSPFDSSLPAELQFRVPNKAWRG